MSMLISSITRLIRNNLRFAIMLGLLVYNATAALSQNYKVTGKIIDKSDNQAVIGAFVYLGDLKDSADRVATTTDVNGKFLLSGLKKKSYRLTIQSINYPRESRVLNLAKPVTDLGTIILTMESKVLKEVVVVGQGTAVQKGDTTVMTADAFKVNVDANAEDLVKKMPGITVENGTISARGEAVKQVLVDGKPFFGDDPSVALRNLPAEVIDRVQVYNKLSDQAELTGFDDGESSRTINIITRRNNKYSTFGKITGGTDFSDKYLVGGSLNIFSGPRRFTISGMTNNINQQNFAMQDLIGSTGGSSSRGNWGGRQFGGAGGISTNSSLGFNYQDNWGKKASVSGSYFFNSSKNNTVTQNKTEYLSSSEETQKGIDTSNTTSQNYNHRINMRIEYSIDSLNSLIIVPRFSIQENNSDRQYVGFVTGGPVNSQTLSTTMTDASGYNIGNDITWRHKFSKPGRTLSVRSSISYDKRDNSNTQMATIDLMPDNQFSETSGDNLSLSTNLNYTEPLGKNGQLQMNYDNRFRRSNNNKEIFDMGERSEVLDRLDSLSNVYDNDYVTNRGGVSYLYKKDKLNFTVGMNYERADLSGTQTFPEEGKVQRTFQKVLPNFMINYKFSEITNLRVFYRTSTEAPSISDLQNAIDNSNRLRLRTGNPDLTQSYSHNLMSNFSYANPTSGFNAFIFLMGNYTKDVMANQTYSAWEDTIDRPGGVDVTLFPGGQLTLPVNLDRSTRLNTMINLSYFVKPIKSNVSFVIGGGYTRSPEGIDDLVNLQNSYNLTNSLIITSNISENVDFTVSYTSNYSMAENSINVNNDNRYWYQSASAKLNLVLWKGFVVNTDVVGQNNKGITDNYNEKYFVWNASVGKKFLKNKAAEFKVGAYDILNQNSNYYHTVTASYVRDTWTNAYKRYFLILFTYNLRANRGQGQQPQQPQQQQQQDQRDHPPGMPPGGFRPGGGLPGGYHDH